MTMAKPCAKASLYNSGTLIGSVHVARRKARNQGMVSRRWVGIARALVFAVGCCIAVAQSPQSTSGQSGSQGAASIPTIEPSPTFQSRYPRYQVAPSDVLTISFPLSVELNQSVKVQPDGFITLGNLGSVYVEGQTTPEVAETLKKAYAKILHDPIIVVDLTNFQAPRFTIFGQVSRPGEYALRYPTTVSQAVAIGGGLLGSAKYQALLLRRVSSDWMEVKKLNVNALVHGKKVSEDIPLQPGDMIYVPETTLAKVKRYLPYSTGIGVSPQSIVQALE